MNTTVRMKASDLSKDWHVIDAAGRPLGRVATEAATLLRGKHKPTYEPHLDGGDFVVIVNAARVKVSGNKSQTMVYYRHSGYPGGLKSRTFEEQIERFPDKVIERAVHGMLPKGSLGLQLRKHLKVYAGPEHPHQAQVTGSEKARAKREEEEQANGPRLQRVMPKLSRLYVPGAAQPGADDDVAEEPVAGITAEDAAAEAPAAELETAAAVAEAPEAPTEEAASTDTDDGGEAKTATRAPRRRARKTEATEDSEE